MQRGVSLMVTLAMTEAAFQARAASFVGAIARAAGVGPASVWVIAVMPAAAAATGAAVGARRDRRETPRSNGVTVETAIETDDAAEVAAALTEGGINQALADAGLPPAQAIQTKVHTSDRVPDASPAPHEDASWGVTALSGTWVTVLLGFAGCTCFGFGMCLFSHLRRVRRPPSPPPSPPMIPAGASARTQPLGAQSHEPDSITDSMVEAQVVRGVPMRVMSQRMEDVMEEAAAPIYPPPYPVVVRNGEGHVTVSLRSVEAHAAAETPDAGIPSAPPAPVYGQVWNGVS